MTTAHWGVSILAGLVLCAAVGAEEETVTVTSFEAVQGSWEATETGHRGSSTSRGIALHAGSPESDHVTVEAVVRARERIGSAGWATAGVMIYVDGGNFWRFALIDGPQGQKYCEVMEMYRGLWQAHREGRTLLRATSQERAGWQYGRPYRLRIELTADGVEGTMLDAETGRRLAHESYAFDGVPHLPSGRPALALDAMTADFTDVRIAATTREARWPDGAPTIERGEKATLAILVDEFPGADPAKAQAIAVGLRERGFGVTVLSGEQLALAGVLHPAHFDAVVLPEANVFPAEALDPLLRYLRMGGKMAAVGTQPFATRVHKVGGRWVDREGLKGRLVDVRPTHVLEDFEGEGRLDWRRSSDSREHEGALTIQPGGASGTEHGAKVAVEALTGWDTFGGGAMEAPFPEGHTLTCFWAKGDGKTPRMSIEWRERDGSRWIGVVDLERRWRHYAMAPEDFLFWPNGSRAGRGGAGDVFDPANAEEIVFGVAYYHTGRDPGPKTFWVDEVGTARNPSLPRTSCIRWPNPAVFAHRVTPGGCRKTSSWRALENAGSRCADRSDRASERAQSIGGCRSLRREAATGRCGGRRCRCC